MVPKWKDINSSIKGPLLGLCAAALFSLTAAMGKMAATDFHVLQILFFANLLSFSRSSLF